MKKIIDFKYKDLNSLKTIDKILATCYLETNEKFRIGFLGSKGYLSHIEINACGNHAQTNYNRIDCALINQYKGVESLYVGIFFCEKQGVKVIFQGTEILEHAYKKGLRNVNFTDAIALWNNSKSN